ncbi:MAG TPA: NAD(P)/FAD-dependent oxidoreductase [Anaerolineales bacterium]|nr:NAD(P)/FAD-dependent oxidoreductase [Anaerolineales bacterium]
MSRTDILIIGAGQAGLAIAYHLKQTPLSFQLVDGNARVGNSWRKRYDSLTLFTPRSLSGLPGLALRGDADGYASRDEFADYLENYAKYFGFPIELNTKIKRLERLNGHFCATRFDGQEMEARAVVLANGAYQKPVVPSIANDLPGEVSQFSPASYRNPSQIPSGNVVVVGDGATGRDIASELAASHRVYLATGRPRRLMPERIVGVSMWKWLDVLGLLTAPVESFFGKKMRDMDSFPNRDRDLAALRRKGIQIMPKLTAANGNTVTFQNGAQAAVNSVIWATGYRDDSEWVHIPEVKDTQGNFVHQRGIAPIRNFYFIGRPWQMTTGSARIYGVSKDAQFITNELRKTLS